MKKIFLISVLFFAISGKAQTPIYPIQGGESMSHEGAYYKDLDNVFDKFAGEWKYQNGNSSFTIILQKKVMYFDPLGNNYMDMLIGEYKYVDQNGTTLVNTLANLDLTNLVPYENNIAGILILDKDLPIASRTVQLHFDDPERTYLNRAIRLKYIPSQGSSPAKLELEWTGSMSLAPNENSPTQIRVPEQDYILIKQ